jgi:hypothetical protein
MQWRNFYRGHPGDGIVDEEDIVDLGAGKRMLRWRQPQRGDGQKIKMAKNWTT